MLGVQLEPVRSQMLRSMIDRMSLTAGIESPLAVEGARREGRVEIDEWRQWLPELFPGYFTDRFAAHHAVFWEHVWGIKPEVRPRPIICVWPRGGGKSSSVEPAAVALGIKSRRKYAIYVSATQDQADKHVESIGSLLEASSAFAARYPAFANRMIGKYGHSRGWRRNRLTTQAGYTVDAAGLDKGVRGIKREGVRPDVIILDDLDDVLDSPMTIARKIKILVRSILPAGSSDVAIIGVQNLIHPDSIFSRIVDGRADFLMNREVVGPVPAIEGLTYELTAEHTYRITGGRATWEGQSVEACQALMNDIGLSSFLNEAQHEVESNETGMYHQIVWQHCEWREVPPLQRVAVWVDPAVTESDRSDAHGVQVDGLGVDGKLYRLFSWEQRASPEVALQMAILKALELGSDTVGIETDQGGDTWRSTYAKAFEGLVMEGLTEVERAPAFRSEKGGSGHGSKAHRQGQMLHAYERGSIVHVRGTHDVLERALKRFGVRKPFDLADAAYWSFADLMKPVAVVQAPVVLTGASVWMR